MIECADKRTLLIMIKAAHIIKKQNITILNIFPFNDFLKKLKLVTTCATTKKNDTHTKECPEGFPYPELHTISKILLSQ